MKGDVPRSIQGKASFYAAGKECRTPKVLPYIKGNSEENSNKERARQLLRPGHGQGIGKGQSTLIRRENEKRNERHWNLEIMNIETRVSTLYTEGGNLV